MGAQLTKDMIICHCCALYHNLPVQDRPGRADLELVGLDDSELQGIISPGFDLTPMDVRPITDFGVAFSCELSKYPKEMTRILRHMESVEVAKDMIKCLLPIHRAVLDFYQTNCRELSARCVRAIKPDTAYVRERTGQDDMPLELVWGGVKDIFGKISAKVLGGPFECHDSFSRLLHVADGNMPSKDVMRTMIMDARLDALCAMFSNVYSPEELEQARQPLRFVPKPQ